MFFDERTDIEIREQEKPATAPAETPANEQEPEDGYYIKFRKPYTFEDQTYTGVDLSGLEDLCARDMIQAQRVMERSGSINVIPEMSNEFACIIAARATGYPREFFENLPMYDAIKVKNRVTNFLYGSE